MGYHDIGSESRSGGWSQSIPLITGTNKPVNSNQFFEREASTFSVQFEVTPPDTPRYSCEAEISWQLEGNKCTRRVSVVSGMSLTGRGQGVQVQLKDVSTTSARSVYNVTVLASRGVRAFSGIFPILRTFDRFSLAASATTTIAVPKDSGIITLGISPVSAVAANTPQLIVSAGNADLAAITSWNPVLTPGFVPLPPDTNTITLTNVDPANAVLISGLWGVEG